MNPSGSDASVGGSMSYDDKIPVTVEEAKDRVFDIPMPLYRDVLPSPEIPVAQFLDYLGGWRSIVGSR